MFFFVANKFDVIDLIEITKYWDINVLDKAMFFLYFFIERITNK